ncbi:MAG: ribonuclease J, partial [Microbacteriaceae bacterium]|nr:ribonuclease J [Microbacteriaceae bacterium]
IAETLGYLDVPNKVIISPREAEQIPDEYLVYMSTGSQGEPMAVLSRMVNRNHAVEVRSGDTVILASSLIPGNENAVFRVIDGLMRLGAKVVHKGNARVHVSGHAAAGELLYCYNIVRPKNVMPIHGEYRHLIANASLAIETGVPTERTLICQNGTVVDLHGGVAKIVGQYELGSLYVDGKSVGKVTDEDLQQRLVLGSEGIISIVTVISRAGRKIVSGPDIHARGVAEDDHVFDAIKPKIVAALEEELQQSEGKTDKHRLQQVVRRVIGRWVGTRLRRRAAILPIVVEVD